MILPRLIPSIDIDGACFRLGHNAQGDLVTLRSNIQAEVGGSNLRYMAEFDIIKDGMLGMVPELFQSKFTKTFAISASDLIKEMDDGRFTSNRRQKSIDPEQEKELKERWGPTIKAYEEKNEDLKQDFYIPGEVTIRFTGYDDIKQVLSPELEKYNLETLVGMYVYNRNLRPDYVELKQEAMIVDPSRKEELKAKQDKLAEATGLSEYLKEKRELRDNAQTQTIKIMSKLTHFTPSEKAITSYLELMSESFITHLENKLG